MAPPADSKAVPPKDRSDAMSTCSEPEMDYFYHYSRDLLVCGIKNCIQECREGEPIINGKPANLRPFRILISLLDRPEIGSSILEDILIEIFRCMYGECMILSGSGAYYNGGSSSEQKNGLQSKSKRKVTSKSKREERLLMIEVIKTANLLFGAFEPFYIWDFIGRTFEKTCMDADKNKKGVSGEGDVSISELCVLVDFLLDKVSLVSRGW